MLKKEIIYSRKKVILACDGNCNKAWGITNRKSIIIDNEDNDDTMFLPDDELGVAPVNPGTYEGYDAKPTNPNERLNRWCCRECERSSIFNIDEDNIDEKLKDFSKPIYNIKTKYINLNCKDSNNKLIGFEKGKEYYKNYLKNKIYTGRNHVIEIDSSVYEISVSFIEGIIEGALLNNIEKDKFKKIVKFKGKKDIIEKIKISLE